MKKFVAAIAALCLTAPAAGQNLPFPAAGEFGPHAAAPDGLVVNDHLVPGQAHTTGEGAPGASYRPNSDGAFRVICAPGHVLADDPVVYPNKPGRSHLHQFYGNLATTAASTYESTRAIGATTCRNPLNRSAYWMPAMLIPPAVEGQPWQVQRPESVSLYYKREPANSPVCDPTSDWYAGECTAIPNALRFITGYDMISGTTLNGALYFKCIAPDGVNRSSFYDDMTTAAKFCLLGDQLDVGLDASTCWDGINLDSPNHKSHMANRIMGPKGHLKCPDSHPKYIVHFTLQALYLVNDRLDRSGTWEAGRKTWYLSSDAMFGMPPHRPGSTLHADYFEGWNPQVKKAWMDNCIDRLLTCSAGDLGNGWQMKEEYPITFRADNPGSRFLPLPAGMTGPFLRNKLHATH